MTTIPKTRQRWLAPSIAGGAALALGLGIGYAAQPEPEVIIETETETVTETETITEEVEVEVQVTPASCERAMDAAEEVIDLLSDSLDASGDAVISAGTFDNDGVDAATARIEANNEALEDPAWNWGFWGSGCREDYTP